MKLLIASILLALGVVAFAQDNAGYTCPMHPHIHSEHEGVCPICGMNLVPIETGDGNDAHDHDGGREAGTISIAPEIVQKIGVRTERATVAEFGRRVRAFGRVAPSTRLETVVASRVEGWLEDLAVTAEGDTVDAGARLYRVYSPDLIAAQQDFLAALRSGSDARTQSAARRLRSLGMQTGVIETLRKSRRLIENVPVYAEAGGTVSMLAARNGAYVKPGDTVLRLQDYAQVWVLASVAEQDLAGIGDETPVELDFPAAPGAQRHGNVDYVFPTVDPKTRTGQVRIVVDNETGTIKPGAYVDVTFSVGAARRLAVPTEAILRDSRGAHVVLALGNGRYRSRIVTTGVAAGGLTQIVAGLDAGDEVVVSAQFLIDSETNLREGFRKMDPSHAGHH